MISAGKVIERDERRIPSRIGSLLFWKRIFTGQVDEWKWIGPIMRANSFSFKDTSYSDWLDIQEKLYNVDYCKFCDGLGRRKDKYGDYYCLCWLLREKLELGQACADWGSDWTHQGLEGMKLIGHRPGDIANLKKAIDRTSSWIDYPDRWLVYSGPTGTGKTHMLNAIMSAWYPFAMYIVASDFEDRLRRYLTDDGKLIQKYIQTLMFHPILVFDDIGMEYSSPWITAKLDAIIEHRSRKVHWWDLLSVFATNIRMKDIKSRFVREEGVSRIGSRLTDTEIVDWLILDGADYRNKQR